METATNATLAIGPATGGLDVNEVIFTLAKLAIWIWGCLKLVVPYVIGAIVYLNFMRHFVVDVRYIPSRSMYPTFEIDDLVLIDKISYWFTSPQINDIVLFKPPPALYQNPKGIFVKRIVAQAGDLVQVLQGRLVVNGFIQNENYVAECRRAVDMRPVLVPEGHVFVMGDNRNLSFDSSHWGPLPATNIVGRSVTGFRVPTVLLPTPTLDRPLERRRSFEFLPSAGP